MAVLGGAAELVIAAVGTATAGAAGLAAAVTGGLIAAAAQVAAVARLRPAMRAPGRLFMRRWATGVAIRGASVVVLLAVVLATRAVLPPLWLALGFLGVMLTLLFAETRFLS